MKTKKPIKKPKLNQLDIFDYGSLNEEAKAYIKTAYHAKKAKVINWRGMIAVPPGSLLESVITEFQKNTNIPLEIPFITIMHYISAYLVSNNIYIKVRGKKVYADFWTIVLAESGAGKTYTKNEISSNFGSIVPELQGSSVSAASFVDELSEKPHSLWIRDEFLQLLKVMEQPGGPMAELKDYLLRIYDNAPISRKTKKYDICVDNPAISLLGFNALSPFIDSMSGESLVDGFAQRFAYVLAKKDQERHFKDYPIWTVDGSKWKDKWELLIKDIQAEYTTDSSAEKGFSETFKNLVSVNIDESFYRRVLWRAHKYALIYHILCGKAKDMIVTSEDYAWAARMIIIQLSDASEVISMTSSSDLGKLIDKAEAYIEKMKSSGKEVTPRTLTQNVRGINSVATARFVMDILKL